MPAKGILNINSGDATGKKNFPVVNEIFIGREAKNDIVLPYLNISRKHAKVYQDPDGRYWIEDLGSHNGTLLNGRLARKELLQDGDIINIADVELNFSFSEAEVSNEKTKLTEEDLGVMGIDSTSFIDLTELKKEQMEDLRKKKPNITDPWKTN